MLETLPTFMKLDYPAIRSNLAALRRHLAAGVEIIPSLKANAYGHGVEAVARELAGCHVRMVSTGSLEDARALRRAGLPFEILMFAGPLPAGLAELLGLNLIPTVHTLEHAEAVSAFSAGRRSKVFIKIDCGHGRLGFPVQTALEIVEKIAKMPGIAIEGLYTHLPFSAPSGRAWAEAGIARFETLVRELRQRGIEIPITQARASAAIVTGLADSCSAVCPGGLLYGKSPLNEPFADQDLFRPVLRRVTSRLIQITTDLTGSRYKDRVKGPTGVIPFGRAHGNRPAKAGAVSRVLVNGAAAPVLALSLEHCVIDLSNVPAPALGDRVTIIGTDREQQISLLDVAEAQGVSESDVLMSLNGRIERLNASDMAPSRDRRD